MNTNSKIKLIEEVLSFNVRDFDAVVEAIDTGIVEGTELEDFVDDLIANGAIDNGDDPFTGEQLLMIECDGFQIEVVIGDEFEIYVD